MKILLIILLQILSPFFVLGVTDDEMILSKEDAKSMFSMAKEDWIQNVKTAKAAGATFPCPDKKNLSLCIDTGIAFMATVPNYLPGENYPNALNVVMQYKTPNFLTEKQFEKVVETSKKEMSPEYHVDQIWGTLPAEIYTVVQFVVTKKIKEEFSVDEKKRKILEQYQHSGEFKLVHNPNNEYFHYVNPMGEPITGYQYKRKINTFSSHIIDYGKERKFQIVEASCEDKKITISEPFENVFKTVVFNKFMTPREIKIYCDTDFTPQREIYYCKYKKLKDLENTPTDDQIIKANSDCTN